MKGLDIEEKSERVKNYALNLVAHNYELLGALGLKNFSELKSEHVIKPSVFTDSQNYADLV